MNIRKEIMEEFRKEFLMKGSECTWESYPEPDEIEAFMSQAFERAYREGQKNGKSAYKGQLKREWYMKGFKDGQHPQEKKK